MSARERLTPETAGATLIRMLKQIIDMNHDRCEAIGDDEGVTDRDNLMASGIVSRIDYDERTGGFVLNDKDVLRQDRTGGETEQDVAKWVILFLKKHSEEILYRLLARHFVLLINGGLIGISAQKKPDRHAPLPAISSPRRQAHA